MNTSGDSGASGADIMSTASERCLFGRRFVLGDDRDLVAVAGIVLVCADFRAHVDLDQLRLAPRHFVILQVIQDYAERPFGSSQPFRSRTFRLRVRDGENHARTSPWVGGGGWGAPVELRVQNL